MTNTGPSVLAGDLGVYPGTSITDFPPGNVVGGTTHTTDAHAQQSQIDLTTPYNSATAQAPDATSPPDLDGQTLVEGVYSSSTAQLTGTPTLDAQGDAAAVWVFQIGSEFVGTIMALTSVTVTSGTVVEGRALARNGSVTLDNNVFTDPRCTGGEPENLALPVNPANPGLPAGPELLASLANLALLVSPEPLLPFPQARPGKRQRCDRRRATARGHRHRCGEPPGSRFHGTSRRNRWDPPDSGHRTPSDRATGLAASRGASWRSLSETSGPDAMFPCPLMAPVIGSSEPLSLFRRGRRSRCRQTASRLPRRSRMRRYV